MLFYLQSLAVNELQILRCINIVAITYQRNLDLLDLGSR